MKSKYKLLNLAALGYDSRIVDEDLFLWFHRIQRQQNTIVKLATDDALANGEFDLAIKAVTECACDVLEVERASVWLLSESNRELRCVNLFERKQKRHSEGQVIHIDNYPHYSRALMTHRAVAAEHALTDPRTLKFADDFYIPFKIASVLNAAIRVSGKIIGVVCHEHVGKPRHWFNDEVNFAGELADQMAHVLINCKRRQAEEALQRANNELEARVRERTIELSEEIAERKRIEIKEKLLQVQLLQSEKLSSIGLLAAGVAHELNSPLTGLLSLLRLYQKKSQAGSEDYEILSEMLEASEHMAKIVKDLNDFSKVTEDEQTTIDLHDVIEATLSFSGYQLVNRNVTIIKDYAVDLPPVMGKKCQLQQVVLNLLTNARDAMPKGGTLKIRTGFDIMANAVVVEFADTGEGIKEEHLPKIFDPFFTTKGRGKGTGLGLSVSHGIIKSHKGEFTVESVWGKGTKFVIKLAALINNNKHEVSYARDEQRESISYR